MRVVLPADAAGLAFRPLLLAHAGGRPLAAQGVTLVRQLSPDDETASRVLSELIARVRALAAQ